MNYTLIDTQQKFSELVIKSVEFSPIFSDPINTLWGGRECTLYEISESVHDEIKQIMKKDKLITIYFPIRYNNQNILMLDCYQAINKKYYLAVRIFS